MELIVHYNIIVPCADATEEANLDTDICLTITKGAFKVESLVRLRRIGLLYWFPVARHWKIWNLVEAMAIIFLRDKRVVLKNKGNCSL